ncbi:MAG: hypothetical protein JRI25_11500 [Deltaproteobacteria bacterium]|nr:hypothetical protein [Deltaproteobacteria bacterium]
MTDEPTIRDAFQTLILREVLQAKGLQGDIDTAALVEDIGKSSAEAAAALVGVVAAVRIGKAGGVFVNAVAKEAIIGATKRSRSLSAIRSVRKLVQRVKGTSESTAHSCCRTALCHALAGDYERAELWLLDAERFMGDLTRPNHIRGLMAGANGNPTRAAQLLTQSLDGRAKAVTKDRVREAIALVEP